MSTEFVLFRTAGTNEPEPILIRQSGSAQVTLVMDDGEGGGYQNVEGDLKSVWEKLTGKMSTLEALDEHLTWSQGGGTDESALAICCHDRRPRSPTFGGIAPPAAVLLDETGSAAGIFARHRCGRTYQDLNFAIRQYPEQAETEPSTKIAKPGVALTPLPARGEASGQPNFVASGRPVDPLQDELEIEGQFEFADQIITLQRDQIAASNLALDDKAEPFEEDLDRAGKGHLQNRSHV